MTKTTIIFLVIALTMVIATSSYMNKLDSRLAGYEYQGNEGKNSFTINMKLIGGKRFGSDLMWIKQVLDIGGQAGGYDDVNYISDKDVPILIKKNSEAISYLDPYFLGNYYFSAPITAMIKIYDRPDIGLEILERGMEYNDDALLKFYFAGIIAYKKGNAEELIAQFEKIIEKYRDDMITDIVAYIYEDKYKATKNIEYLSKSYYYRIKLLESKDMKYRNEAEKKVEEFGKILKSYQK